MSCFRAWPAPHAIVGILNCTPDSFADGGRYSSVQHAIDAGLAMIDQGAAIIDVGGESTRPGSQPVSPDEQVRRVVPVIAGLAAGLAQGPRSAALLSIDTTNAQVAQAALDHGACIVNDISAGNDDPAMLPLVAAARAGIILMHRSRPPHADRFSDQYVASTQPIPDEVDVAGLVRDALAARVEAARAAGIAPTHIALDPGLGFGKTVAQNLALIRTTPRLAALGHPIVSALSRKSFVGRITLGRDSTPGERLSGTLALSLIHAAQGATLLRVHDVAEHAQMLRALHALPFT